MRKWKIMQINQKGSYTLDAVSLDNVVVFPNITATFELRDLSAIAAIKAAHAKNEMVFLVTEYESDDGTGNVSLYNVGVVSKIEKFVRLSEKKYQVVAEGLFRAKIVSLESDVGLVATVEKLETEPYYRLSFLKANTETPIALSVEFSGGEKTGIIGAITCRSKVLDDTPPEKTIGKSL